SVGTWLLWSSLTTPDAGTPVQAVAAPADATAPETHQAGTAASSAAPGMSSLAQVLHAAPRADTPDAAWSRLFGLWQLPYEPGAQAACLQALHQGLECLELQGDLTDLRRFNRPALLALQDDQGGMHEAVI